ncbi:cell division protein FtsQ [Streptococcus rupicaprae]|uniref:Cell division protein FtsQ n=1 Tax=Streptococcus rupicaprae TaxID=759619 RepID=A0ABV2FID0_9STRE
MSEKEYPQEGIEQEIQEISDQETIDLDEWQVKNQAYLEKRAREKELAKEAEIEKKETPDETSSEETSEEPSSEAEALLEEEVDSDTSEQEVSDGELTGETLEPSVQGQEDEELAEEAEELSDEDSQDLLLVEEAEPIVGPLKLKKRRPKNPKKRAFIYKTVFFGTFLFLMLIGCLYLVSPLSKLKQFEVSGLTNTTKEQVLLATNLTESDYTAGVLLNKQKIEETVENQLVWVDKARLTYQFPTTFKIDVKEKYIVGYVKDGASYYPVLSSGETIDAAVTEEGLPGNYLLFRVTDLDLIKNFVVDLAESDLLSITQHIQTVDVSPTQATNDLLTLNMVEGHTVLVPLSELGKKLAFYEAVSRDLMIPSYIDMEAGIYTYAK